MGRIAQRVVRPVLPGRDDPLIQQILQLRQRPQVFALQQTSAPIGVRPVYPATNWANSVATEPSIDSMCPLSVGAPSGSVQVDPQEPAGVLERDRHEHRPVVDDDRGRDHHRPGRGMLQPLVQARQPTPGQHRPRHGKGLRPSRPHRLRRGGACQQQAGVHRLRRRAQHRGGDRPGRDIYHAGELALPGHAVGQQDQHVQRGGVHLHQLARRLRLPLPEHALRLARQGPAGDRRPAGPLPRWTRRRRSGNRSPGTASPCPDERRPAAARPAR